MKSVVCIAALAMLAASQAHAQAPGASAYAQMSAYLVYDDKCHVLNPLQQKGLIAPQTVNAALVAKDRQADAQAQADKLIVNSKATACDGHDGEVAKPDLVRHADGEVSLWLLRADALAKADAATTWAKDMTALAPQAKALAANTAALRAANPTQGAYFDQFAPEAAQALKLACDGRKTVRSAAGPRACPALTPAEQAVPPGYAEAWLTQAEAVAVEYVGFLAAKAAQAR